MDHAYFSGHKVLITGGLGFIGSNLARRLVDTGARVTLVDNLLPQHGGNVFNIDGIEGRVRVNVCDVRDEFSMGYLVRGQDYLFNLAGQTSHLDSMQDPIKDLEINAEAQLVLLETCLKCNPNIKIVYTGTRQVYGRPDYLPVDEKHLVRPIDINGVNKMAAEWYHLIYKSAYDLQTCILRLTNTIGPRMRVRDSRQTFLGIWIRLLLEGKPFEVWNGHQKRDFTYVDDVVDALLIAAASDKAYGKIFNLGGNCVISLKDLAELLIEVNGEGEYVVKEFPEDRKRIDIGDYYADYNLIQSALGWAPKVPLRDALKRTLDFYRKHLNRYT